MVEAISYKLDMFEGPLDLLLHLIDKDKINIYDIPIASITAQYMEIVNQMEEKDLNTMSDFLVMAATLLEIKAKMLLPKETDPETGEEVDPRAELVARLIEHRKMKRMASELAILEQSAEQLFYKVPTIPREVQRYEEPVNLDALLTGVDLARLQEIFDAVMQRHEDRIDPERSKFGTIRKEQVSVQDTLSRLMTYIRDHKSFSFRDLLDRQTGKLGVIVTFLAVLELTKIGVMHLKQDDLHHDICIDIIDSIDGKEVDLSELEDFEV